MRPSPNLVLAGVLALLAASCGDKPASSGSGSGAPGELAIAWAKWQPADALETLAKDFTKETGVKVTVTQTPWPTYKDKTFVEFSKKSDRYDIVVGEYGMSPSDLIYDALTFTLATGDAEWIESAKETIEGIRLIKRELPGVFTILGVSNVSFGLAPEARAVLNSVFLHHCVGAGLDAAIVK